MESMGLSKSLDWLFDTLIWILLIFGTVALWWLSSSGNRGPAKKSPAEPPEKGTQETHQENPEHRETSQQERQRDPDQ